MRTRGQAVMTTVLFLLFISTAISLGVSSSVSRTLRATEQGVSTRQGYFTAESGVEDIAYRFKTGRQTGTSETLGLNGATTTTTVTDLGGGQKEILSVGDINSYIRKVRMRLVTTSGVSFNYGVQAGAGGFVLSNNAAVVGNVYANGDIVGSNGAYITGTAVSANSAALAPDQVNDAPTPPPSGIVFGNASGTQDFAQSFTVGTTSPVNTVALYIKRTSTTPANATVRIAVDQGGSPGAAIVSATLSSSLVTTSYGWVEVVMPDGVTLFDGTTYWLVLDASTGSGTKHYTIAGNETYGGGTGKTGSFGGVWNATVPAGLDGYFRTYMGGRTGLISNVDIGLSGVGNAWAHTVEDSTIAGINYCQTGSGNNKPCTTSQADPTSIGFPISDGNIEAWKEGGEAGGVLTGDYVPTGSVTLGPKRITGNLVVDNNATLTVTGTLWVEGNVTVSNGGRIRLSPSYGSSGGIIVADGRVSVFNNALFSGSGQSGSYIMVVTTSACPNGPSCAGANAIDLSNNAGAVVLVAPYGTLRVANNAGANEATANKIILDNGAVIVYTSGLSNLNFSSGPGGSFNVGSWREVR